MKIFMQNEDIKLEFTILNFHIAIIFKVSMVILFVYTCPLVHQATSPCLSAVGCA